MLKYIGIFLHPYPDVEKSVWFCWEPITSYNPCLWCGEYIYLWKNLFMQMKYSIGNKSTVFIIVSGIVSFLNDTQPFMHICWADTISHLIQ